MNALKQNSNGTLNSDLVLHKAKTGIQAQLSINKPGDIYEHEADAMAERIMRMSAIPNKPEPLTGLIGASVQRKCTTCKEEEEKKRRLMRKTADGFSDIYSSPSLVASLNASRGGGSPLPGGTKQFMENAFSTDFSLVRVHTGSLASEMSKGINAKAFTSGRDIYFKEGQYNPDSSEGKHLLAHELTHVVQQGSNIQMTSIHRYPSCTSAQDTTLAADHSLALEMLRNAITITSSYDGTNPVKVRTALSRHFNGATSNAFATWININLRALRMAMDDDYECFTGGFLESAWSCGPNVLATAFWCVPGFDIRICPLYFQQTPEERATTLIHEWVHKFGCNFDLGYEHETDAYGSNSTLTQLVNADSFAHYVKDVQ